MAGLTLSFIPYSEIEDLGSAKRVHKILELVKQNKVVVLEGRLKKEEEADLIEITMESIGKKFKGIELAVINPDKKYEGFDGLRKGFMKVLMGDRVGLTIVGPAAVVKKIKKNPNKIELLTKTTRRKR